jgi:hypothetical protein
VDLDPILRGEKVALPPSVFERGDRIRLLYPCCINMLMGESESCKSWIAAAVVAVELIAGHHVIYADYEDGPETLVERLRALGVAPEQIKASLTYLNPDGPFDDLAQAVIAEAIQLRGPPTLGVADGVTEAMSNIGLDPISGKDVVTYFAGFPSWLASTGAAVCLIDHVTKSQEGRGRWAIGSERKISGLTGAAYICETIAPFGRGMTGTVRISIAKDRRGHVRPHQDARKVIVMAELKSWPDDGVTISFSAPESSTDGAFRPTYLMTRLSQTIVEQPGLTKALSGRPCRGRTTSRTWRSNCLSMRTMSKSSKAPAVLTSTTPSGRLRSARTVTQMSQSDLAPTLPQRAPGTVTFPQTSVPLAPSLRRARSHTGCEVRGVGIKNSVCPDEEVTP